MPSLPRPPDDKIVRRSRARGAVVPLAPYLTDALMHWRTDALRTGYGKMRIGVVRLGVVAFLAAILSLSPSAGLSQDRVARVDVDQENFRKDPNGRILATVVQGNEFPVVDQQGDWVEVELQGWIWAASVTATNRDGFDLVVSADGGENLRIRPQGRIVARLREGFLLNRTGASGSWIQVSRRGWLWRRSLELVQGGGAPTASAGDGAAANEDGGNAPGQMPSILTTPMPVAVHANPDGDTVAVFQPGAQANALGRTGDWIQVRIDGWIYAPAVLDSALDLTDTGDLTPAQLRSDPARYRGALVRWRVQFIGLRRAEAARSDFEEGEPYLLARGPAGDPGFVYLAVPSELLPVAESLQPLTYVTVVGRVRTGRSALLGNPIIDLTEIETQLAAR